MKKRGYRFPWQSLPQWGRQRGGGFAAKKGSQPRLAALGSPFQGKGLAWILPPSSGRRCPEGAEVGWGKRYEREGGMRLKSTIYESTLSTAGAVPLPRVGKVASGASRIGFWRDEKERRRSSQVRRLREYPSTAQKGSQPRLAALGSPFQGKGLAWTLPPSFGRRCPEGAEVGWGKRDEKGREIVSGRRFTKAPSAKTAYKTYL